MKVLCIGHSSYDISIIVPTYPKENTKYRINTKVESGGGPAANAAYLLGKWGMESYFAGVVGYDTFGNKIKREFETAHVNTSLMETDYENNTSLSFILINEENASRTLFNLATEYKQIQKFKPEEQFDVIMIDGHDYATSKEALKKYPNAISVIDAGRITPELLELCGMVNYIVCSKGFAETVVEKKFDFENPSTLAEIYNALQDKYPKKTIVITLEERGTLYKIDNAIKMLPVIKVEAKDTTGAGDIFHGAFTYAISNNYDLENAIKIATITAGLSVKTIGARLSIPELSEVLEYYESHK